MHEHSIITTLTNLFDDRNNAISLYSSDNTLKHITIYLILHIYLHIKPAAYNALLLAELLAYIYVSSLSGCSAGFS